MSSLDPVRNSQSFCALAKLLATGPPGEVTRCRMGIYISDHPERAAPAVRELNGNMIWQDQRCPRTFIQTVKVHAQRQIVELSSKLREARQSA